MSAIEKELIEATGFSPRREYPDRQDYLAAVARAVNELPDVDFDGLSVEAADWFNVAARALSAKKPLDDFPDAEEAEEQTVGEEVDDETPDEPEEPEETPEEKILRAKVFPEDKPKAKVIKGPNRRSPVPKKLKLPDKRPKGAAAPDAEIDTKWGVYEGSKNHQAVKLLEKGCRMADITVTLGGTYYNLIQKLVKNGHRVERFPNGILKLTYVKPL